jgi:signal transduction histidine kinase
MQNHTTPSSITPFPITSHFALGNSAEAPAATKPLANGASQARIAELEQQVAFLLEQQEALRKQLEESQKLTALGELVSTTTHEFNNVLTTVINYAKLGMRHKDAPTRDKSFEKIHDAGQRAAKITNSILGFARNRAEGLEATDLRRVFDDAMVLLEREMMKYKIRVETQYDAVPPALANGNQIQQVLLNLLINARQAMPSGGQLTLKLSHDTALNMVEMTVRDTGTGMTPEVLKRIFEPRFSTKSGPDASGKGGSGLGLSMCRSIIEAHHGRIRVESAPGKGTAFVIKIPAAG